MKPNVDRPEEGHNRDLGQRTSRGSARSLEDVLYAVLLYAELACRALEAREWSMARTDLEDLRAAGLRGVRLLRDASSLGWVPASGSGPVDLNRPLLRQSLSHLEVRLASSDPTELRLLLVPGKLSNVNLQAPLSWFRWKYGRPEEGGAQVTDASHPGRNP